MPFARITQSLRNKQLRIELSKTTNDSCAKGFEDAVAEAKRRRTAKRRRSGGAAKAVLRQSQTMGSLAHLKGLVGGEAVTAEEAVELLV